MNNSWNLFGRQVEEQIPANESLGKDLHQHILRQKLKATKHHSFLPPLLVVVPTLAVLALIVSLTPTPSPTPDQPLSFIQQALAASKESETPLTEGTARHIVFLTTQGDEAHKIEKWIGADRVSAVIETDMKTAVAIDHKLFRDGMTYVSPEEHDRLKQEQSAMEKNFKNHLATQPVRLVIDQNEGGSSSETRPTSTGWITCVRKEMADEVPPDDATTAAINELQGKIWNLLGVDVGSVGGDEENPGQLVPNFSAVVSLLAASPFVEDRGEETNEELGRVHTYRLVTPRYPNMGTDYLFDTETKQLRQARNWEIGLDGSDLDPSTMTILLDEMVSLSSLPINPLDPTDQGFVQAPDYPSVTWPVRIVPSEGCYAIDKETLTPTKIADDTDTTEIPPSVSDTRNP